MSTCLFAERSRQPRELSLFSGAGGGLLATQYLLGFQTVCYVEQDTYCQRVLQARIADGILDDAPIWDDVRTFNGCPWRGQVDVVSGGFPCQPFSVAGKQAAESDERNCWPDTIRIIREVEPEWCFLENVPGLLSNSHSYFGVMLKDLAESGYDVAWKVLSAAELGAPHKRDRVWIVAHAHGKRLERLELHERLWDSFSTATNLAQTALWQMADCQPLRVDADVPRPMDRVRAVGNGQVPIVAATAWNILTEAIS